MTIYNDRPDKMSDIESLVVKNNIASHQRWGPSPVSSLEQALSCGAFKGMSISLRKNIVYSLQYLQYIQIQIEELKLHSVVYTQLCKSYVIISMGIIEGVFYHLLKSNNKLKKDEWEELNEITTNEFNDNGVKKKHIIRTFQKLSTPTEGKMDFESMISKVRSHHLLKLPQAAYPYIKDLKAIRNKVHLHISKNDADTDYHKLSYVEYYLARYTLYKVLTDEVFEPQNQGDVFESIKPQKEWIAKITPILEQRRQK